MDTHRLSRSLFALFLVALSLPAFAGPSGRAGLSGQVVISLSNAAQTLTVQAANGKQSVLRVTSASRLWRNGSPVGLAGLALRDTVLTGQIDRNTSRVISLRARGPAVTTTRGSVAALDPGLKSLSVTTPAGTREFQIASSTLFVRNGRAATAGDLTARDSVVVHAQPTAAGDPTATDVEADGPEEGEVEGTISAISGSDVTITPKQGAAVTVHATDSTVIRLHLPSGPVAGSLADLKTGMSADASFDPVSFDAVKIDAEQEDGGQGGGGHEQQAEVEGTVSAVDATAQTITITPKTGSPVTLTVGGSTRILLDGATAGLADISVGARANAEYDPATNAALKIEAESASGGGGETEPAEIEGQVTAAAADSITIAPEKSGSPVTLKIDASTVIVIDGKPGAATDIKTGSSAEAKYDPATQVAIGIKVETEHD